MVGSSSATEISRTSSSGRWMDARPHHDVLGEHVEGRLLPPAARGTVGVMPEMVPVDVALGGHQGVLALGADALARQPVGYLVDADNPAV